MIDFVVTVERSTGNESVGSMWVETAVFPSTATLAEVEAWANSLSPSSFSQQLGRDGRVMLSYARRPVA